MDRETLYKFFLKEPLPYEEEVRSGNGWNIPRKTDENS